MARALTPGDEWFITEILSVLAGKQLQIQDNKRLQVPENYRSYLNATQNDNW